MKFRLAVDEQVADVEADEAYVRVDDRRERASVSKGLRGYVVRVRGRRFLVRSDAGGLIVNGVRRRVRVSGLADERGPSDRGPGLPALHELRPPMPGRVVSLLVRPGAEVRRGQPVLVLEAMKMQNEIPSPVEGVVESFRVREGDSVAAHDVLAVLRGRRS